MITITLLERIEHLFPGHDAESVLRRRVVRLLADAGGQLSLDALHAALGPSGRVVLATVRGWDGIVWEQSSSPRAEFSWEQPALISLAPWVRERLGMPPDEEEPRPGPVDAGGTDPLARVRALVARAKNIATVADALAHAYPEIARFRTAS